LCSGCSLMVVLSALGCGVNSAIGSEVVGFGIVVSIGDDIDFLARFDVYDIALAPFALWSLESLRGGVRWPAAHSWHRHPRLAQARRGKHLHEMRARSDGWCRLGPVRAPRSRRIAEMQWVSW
jgi:hypothetical protein